MARGSSSRRSNLRFGVADGIGYSLMVGFGETYLPAFALALGFSEIFTGLLATLPLLAGASLQLVSPAAVARIGSRRRWVILCALVQTASFLPLIGAALTGGATRALLLGAAALYWGANFATGPAWTAWMESVVPRRIRAGFFARRGGLTQLSLFGAILAGGLILQRGQSRGAEMAGFLTVFAAAAASRIFSMLMLRRQTEPVPPDPRREGSPPGATWRRLRASAPGRLLLFLALMQMMVFVSAPYFPAYALRRLEFSYASYMGLLAAAYLAKVVTLLWLSRFSRHRGGLWLLRIGSLGIVPLTALLLVSSSWGYLLGLQVLVGIAWGFYELGMLLVFFEQIGAGERTTVLTLYNLGHAGATVAGSLLGARLFTAAGPHHAYAAIFVASAIGRALLLPLLLRLAPLPAPRWSSWLRPAAWRPAVQVVARPWLTLPGERRQRPRDH